MTTLAPRPVSNNNHHDPYESGFDESFEDSSVTPSELADSLAVLLGAEPSPQPVMVWGPPGIGKSDIARAVAKRNGARFWDVRATLLDPVELRGIPYPEDRPELGYKITRWAPPDFLPPQDSPDDHIVNLDEITTAPDSVQAALYQLILDRRIGDYRLPEGASLIACGNRQSDRAIAKRMSTALASRFVHITLRTDVHDWTTWALQTKLRIEIVNFINKMKPELLHDFNPQSQEHAFPCPRNWSAVHKILEGMEKHPVKARVERAMLEGAVGRAAAAEFIAYLRIHRSLPDPQLVINDPENGPILEQPDVQIAFCSALYRLANESTFRPILAYANRLTPEIGQYMIDQCLRVEPDLQHTRDWIQWTVDHQ